MVSSSSLLALVSSCYVASATLRGGAPPTATGAADAAEVARQSMPPGVPDVVTVEQGMLQGVRATSSNLRYWLGEPNASHVRLCERRADSDRLALRFHYGIK